MGTALLLSGHSTAVSCAAGKGARAAYGKYLNRIFIKKTHHKSWCYRNGSCIVSPGLYCKAKRSWMIAIVGNFCSLAGSRYYSRDPAGGWELAAD